MLCSCRLALSAAKPNEQPPFVPLAIEIPPPDFVCWASPGTSPGPAQPAEPKVDAVLLQVGAERSEAQQLSGASHAYPLDAPAFRCWASPGQVRDQPNLQGREVRVGGDQPFRTCIGEVHLDAGVCAGTFRADHHAFAETCMSHALAEPDRQSIVVETGVAPRSARRVHRPRYLRARPDRKSV